MKDIAKEIIDKTIEETIAKQVEPEDVFNKVIGRLVDKVNEYNAILTELEEYLVKITKNGVNIEKLTCSNILVYLKELKEEYKC